MRIGEQFAPHRHEIELARRDEAIGILGLDPPGADHGDAEPGLDPRRGGDEIVGDIGGMPGRISRPAPRMTVRRDVDRIGAGRLGKPRGRRGILDRNPAVDQEMLAVEPRPDRHIGADRGLHRADDLAQEPRAVFDRAAIVVVAPVGEWRKKRRDQIAVPGVKLDRIDPGAHRALRRACEHRDQRLDVVGGHHLEADLAHCRHRRGEDAIFVLEEPLHHVAAVLTDQRDRGGP